MNKLKPTLSAENKYLPFEIREGLIFATYKLKVRTHEAVMSVVNLRKPFTQGNYYPAIIKYYSPVKTETKTSRFLASPNGFEGISATAVLTDSIYKSTLMNFFIEVLPTWILVRLFNNEKNVSLWLKNNN